MVNAVLTSNKKQGFALTEVMLSVVIMLIVTIGGIAAYRNMVQKNQEQKIENRIYDSIRISQQLRLHMVDYLTDTTGVSYLVSAVNRQLAKDFSNLDATDLPVVSSGASSVNYGILQVTVPLADQKTCQGVAGQLLWNSSNMYKGVTLTGNNGSTAKAGIIDYTKTISSSSSDNNFVPFSFKGSDAGSQNAIPTVTAVNSACLKGANISVYF